MRTTAAALLLIVLAGCSATSPLEEVGEACIDSTDPAARMRCVRALVNSGSEEAIPILIDCLESVKEEGKLPDRNYQAKSWEPNVSVPAELWGIWMITRQDFDFDIEKWRLWYEINKGKLTWDGADRRFIRE